MTTREVYIIRHGDTNYNAGDGKPERIRGWKNIPLSSEGKEEVSKLGDKLAKSGIEILVSSDLLRAKETAKAIENTTGAKIILSPKFRTWDMGEFTGKDSSKITPELVRLAKTKPNKKIPGGESFDEFRERVFAGLREHLMKHDGDLLGIVTHRWVERLLKSWMKEGSPKDHSICFDTMFKHGEKTAHAEKMKIDVANL